MPHPGEPWRELAGLGIFEVASSSGGGIGVVAAVMERLGRVALCGPLAATYVACALLPEEELADLRAGRGLVSLGRPPLLPWAPVATVFVELAAGESWLCTPAGEIEEVDTLAGESWGRCRLAVAARWVTRARHWRSATSRSLPTSPAPPSASSRRQRSTQLIAASSDVRSAISRRVAHPLADVAARLTAARTLARSAAHAADLDGLAATAAAAATARLSATSAALGVAYRAHQTYGAMGFADEGPVARASLRIRQESMLAPGPDAARQKVLAGLGI